MCDFVYADSGISLTKREKETLDLLIKGDSQSQIALSLGISRRMVNRHIASLRQKTKTVSTIAAVVFLIKHTDWVSVSERLPATSNGGK